LVLATGCWSVVEVDKEMNGGVFWGRRSFNQIEADLLFSLFSPPQKKFN